MTERLEQLLRGHSTYTEREYPSRLQLKRILNVRQKGQGICPSPNAELVVFTTTRSFPEIFGRQDAMIRNEGPRIFFYPPHQTYYRASLAPREKPGGGVDGARNSVVFDTVVDEWVGTISVAGRLSISDFEPADLVELLDAALKR